jgi:hypothetical protein
MYIFKKIWLVCFEKIIFAPHLKVGKERKKNGLTPFPSLSIERGAVQRVTGESTRIFKSQFESNLKVFFYIGEVGEWLNPTVC